MATNGYHAFPNIRSLPAPSLGDRMKRPPPEDVFWSRVDRAGDCWEYRGVREGNGYGRFRIRSLGDVRGAHRVAWTLTFGLIPKGAHVLHRCDNPPCCNPDHLFLGTSQDNVADKVAKHRQARGEGIASARLTTQQVLDIRHRHSAGESQRSLSRAFGVARPTIRRVVGGVYWTHVREAT